MVLTLHPLKGGWYGVQCPDDPSLITEARSVEEAFEMARDAAKALARARAKEKVEVLGKRRRKSA